MKTPTLQQFQSWARDNRLLALAVCQAQAFAECERKRVDAYQLPIFKRYNFKVREEWLKPDSRHQQTIDSPRDLYLSDQEELCAQYYAECHAANIAHGWKGNPDHCPALVAENLLMEAQRALLESGAELLGMDLTACYGDLRKRALDLLLGACLAKQPAKAA